MRPTNVPTCLCQILLFLACLGSSLPATAGKPALLSPAADCDEALVQLPVTYASDTLKAAMAPFSEALTADHLNAFGMRCHKKERFEESAHFFGLAISLDPQHALAHYNRACALVRLREQGGVPCDDPDTMTETIAHHLRAAITLDSRRAERSRTDRDLDWARKMIGFRLMYLGKPSSPSEMAALFDGVTLWGPTPGVYLHAEVSFQRTNAEGLTGTVSGWELLNFIDAGDSAPVPVQGTWRAEEGKIIVDWAGEPPRTETITLDAMNQYGGGRWFSWPSECEA